MGEDSLKETMLNSEQWFLCYGEEDNMNYGKLVDLIGQVLHTRSEDVPVKHSRIIKKCLKAQEYAFRDCELKYRPNWDTRQAIWMGPTTVKGYAERKAEQKAVYDAIKHDIDLSDYE